jgi:ketosteroid isomerase-like protein
MTNATTIGTAHNFYDAVERRDFSACLSLLTTDCTVWNEHERIDRPARTVYDGTGPLWSAVNEMLYTERKCTAPGPAVTMAYLARGTTVRGKDFAVPVRARLLFGDDGLIKSIEEFFDPADMTALHTALAG